MGSKPAPDKAAVTQGGTRGHPIIGKKILVVSDLQIPFHDPEVIPLVYAFARRWKPDTLIVNGDLTDCYDLSDYDKNPLNVNRLQLEIEGVAEFFGHLRAIPQKIWLGGNHEYRWKRILWRLQNYGPGVNELLKALMNAAEVGEDADAAFRFAFGTKAAGVTYWPYGDYISLAENNLIVTHGFRLSQHSGYSARMHYDRLGRSVIIGHSHRMASYRVTNLRGTHGAWENGCLCRLDPEYLSFPNWQQGFSIVTIDGPMFHVEQIPILPGPSILYSGWIVR